MNRHQKLFATFTFAFLQIANGGFAESTETIAPELQNLEHGGLALGGYDPVSYFKLGGPLKGTQAIESEFNGVHFSFANEANRSEFETDPVKYSPEFGGWCAWAMLEGHKVEVDPESYKIHEGKLLLFYNGLWGDTLKKWNRKSQSVPESELYQTAFKQWKAILTK